MLWLLSFQLSDQGPQLLLVKFVVPLCNFLEFELVKGYISDLVRSLSFSLILKGIKTPFYNSVVRLFYANIPE